MLTAIFSAVGAGLSLTQAGVQAAEKDRDFQRLNTCVFDYEQKAKKYRDKMWSTVIFTPERAEFEKLANAWQKKADTARVKGCPAPKQVEVATFQPTVAAATDNTTELLIAGAGVLAVGVMVYALTRNRGT